MAYADTSIINSIREKYIKLLFHINSINATKCIATVTISWYQWDLTNILTILGKKIFESALIVESTS